MSFIHMEVWHVEPLKIDKYSNKAATAHLSGSSVTPDQTNKPDMKPHAPQIQNPHAVSTWWRHIWIAPRVYTFDGSTSFIHKEVWHVEPRKIDTYSNKAAAAHLSGSSVTDWQLGPQSKEDFGILHLQLACFSRVLPQCCWGLPVPGLIASL